LLDTLTTGLTPIQEHARLKLGASRVVEWDQLWHEEKMELEAMGKKFLGLPGSGGKIEYQQVLLHLNESIDNVPQLISLLFKLELRTSGASVTRRVPPTIQCSRFHIPTCRMFVHFFERKTGRARSASHGP
jgi:hypothetical protein